MIITGLSLSSSAFSGCPVLQADELAVDLRPRGDEVVAVGGPGADDLGTARFHERVQLAERVGEVVGVFLLVAEAVQGDGLAAEVDVGEPRQELGPALVLAVGRKAGQQAFAQGGGAEDEVSSWR
jgi:hypothetical protein